MKNIKIWVKTYIEYAIKNIISIIISKRRKFKIIYIKIFIFFSEKKLKFYCFNISHLYLSLYIYNIHYISRSNI